MKNIIKNIIGWNNKNTGKLKQYFKKILSWDIDIALRYKPIVSFIKKNINENENILEVGSSSAGLANYINRKITGLDVSFEGVKLSNLKEVHGASSKMPFKDKEFDVIVCLDMLEHIPNEERRETILETFRVSKKYIIIGAPIGPEGLKLDNIYDARFKKMFKKEHAFIKEHIKYGLPDIEKILNETKLYNFKILNIVNNAPIFLWKIINLNFMRRNFIVNFILRIFFPFIALLKGKNYYRKIYFIEVLN